MQERKIEINGRPLRYYIKTTSYGELDDGYTTIFYDETKVSYRKKYWLFGPTVKIEKPIELFRIFANADSPSLPKSWWRERITEKLELLNRSQELKNGELI